jgi:hypothetical protein
MTFERTSTEIRALSQEIVRMVERANAPYIPNNIYISACNDADAASRYVVEYLAFGHDSAWRKAEIVLAHGNAHISAHFAYANRVG